MQYRNKQIIDFSSLGCKIFRIDLAPQLTPILTLTLTLTLILILILTLTLTNLNPYPNPNANPNPKVGRVRGLF